MQSKNLPMVQRIHGGPWYRDWWGWDAENQFWATRGYGTKFALFSSLFLPSQSLYKESILPDGEATFFL